MLLGKTRHWARLAVCFASGECPTILARGLYFTQNHRVIITKIMCVDLYYIHIHVHTYICMYMYTNTYTCLKHIHIHTNLICTYIKTVSINLYVK